MGDLEARQGRFRVFRFAIACICLNLSSQWCVAMCVISVCCRLSVRAVNQTDV